MMLTDHGTPATYRAGCRCLTCRVAQSARDQDRRTARIARQPWRVRYIARTGLYCVTNQLTREIHTRTPSLQEAYELREALNALDARESETPPLWAGWEQVREVRVHLRQAQRVGVGLTGISRESGVCRKRLAEILAASQGLRLRTTTAERILAARVTGDLAAPGVYVPARETWRLIGELQRAGLRKADIARALGNQKPQLQLQRERVRKATADEVRALHDLAYRGSARLREVCGCVEWRR